MSAERSRERLRRIRPVVAAADGEHPARDLCRACADALVVAGAGVMVMSGGLPTRLSWSDPIAARIEDLQQTLGEGPCLDAHHSGRPVSEPDLAWPRQARWAAFGPAALAAGAGAIFSFPLRVGGVRLGALTLHQPRPGHLSDDQHNDARAIAGVVASAVLAIQARAPAGTLGSELEVLASDRAELHQASGMVSVQLALGLGEALVRLRAHAYAADRPLVDVAADIIARRLRLEE